MQSDRPWAIDPYRGSPNIAVTWGKLSVGSPAKEANVTEAARVVRMVLSGRSLIPVFRDRLTGLHGARHRSNEAENKDKNP